MKFEIKAGMNRNVKILTISGVLMLGSIILAVLLATKTHAEDMNSALMESDEALELIINSDQTAPEITVDLPSPSNEEDGICYYNEGISAVITICELNFYGQDVEILISKQNEVISFTPVWVSQGENFYTANLELEEDGEYTISVNYTDRSGNHAEGFESPSLVVDTEITKPELAINGEGLEGFAGSYAKDAEIVFNFEDVNFEEYKISITRCNLASSEDVTETFISVEENENGGNGSFKIPESRENDGIYYMDLNIIDKAGNSASSWLMFTINRYGSVYVYDDYLVSVISDGGQYLKIEEGNDAAVTGDFKITEYSASQLLDESIQAVITREGELIDSNMKIAAEASSGKNKWFAYRYTIPKSDFTEDGTYDITLTSAYLSSDAGIATSASLPSNSKNSKGEDVVDRMTFTVDTTPPEFRNITNLEDALVVASSVEVSYTVVDVGGLAGVEIYLNGEMIENITEFEEDDGLGNYIYNGSFTIEASNEPQTVRLLAADLAGNVADTDLLDLSSEGLYEFNDTITVLPDSAAAAASFLGIIIIISGMVLALISGGLAAFILHRRKKRL